MKIPFIILALFVTTYSFAQKKTKEPNWADTTYILVKLLDTIKNNKIVVIDIGQKATIYLSAKLLKRDAIKSSNDYNKKDITKIIVLLDRLSLKSDTIILDQFMAHLDYLVSDELQNGYAKVFYKKQHIFVEGISHRLEKYGMYAHRFFYLPDKRPFFSTMEYSGIIEDGKYFSDPSELIKVGEKLASLRKQ